MIGGIPGRGEDQGEAHSHAQSSSRKYIDGRNPGGSPGVPRDGQNIYFPRADIRCDIFDGGFDGRSTGGDPGCRVMGVSHDLDIQKSPRHTGESWEYIPGQAERG